MKKFILLLILFNVFTFAQEASTGNILEDHDNAVEGILSDEIKKQKQIINKALAKQSNDVLFNQATYSFLGIIGTIILEGNNARQSCKLHSNDFRAYASVPVLEMKEINESNEPESLKKMRKSRVRVNSMLGSIPIGKWVIVSLRMPKAFLDRIF